MNQRRKSVIPPETPDGLNGSLATTHIIDLLQFLNASAKTGELSLVDGESSAKLFIVKGALVHGACGSLAGMDALVEVIGWSSGNFKFSDAVLSPQNTMLMPTQQALMEAVRILDERQSQGVDGGETAEGRSLEMAQTDKTSTDVLEELLKVPGVTSAVVVGRDGFIIEAAGGSSAIALDDLGAALANAINSIEEMGSELQIAKFQDLFVEYGRAVIMCRPVGDAIIAITAPDSTKLGIIRHKARPLVEEMTNFF